MADNPYDSYVNDEVFEACGEVQQSRASSGFTGRTFIGAETNLSVRSEYNRADYDRYRQREALPCTDEETIHLAMLAYNHNPIVHSIIDMMGDFTTSGIRLTHPNKAIENFHKNWAKTVDFADVSERIANTVYRTGNCPVKIRMGRVSVPFETDWRRSHARDDIKLQKQKTQSRVIPLGYNLLNPLSIEIIGGELSAFIGKPIYALKIGHKFRFMISDMERRAVNNQQIHEMLRVIPDTMRQSIVAGRAVIPLDQDKIEMLHYKKDDWKVWAMPIHAPVLGALMRLEKMHLADLSALDGAISSVRLWQLGDLEKGILPTKAMINKLRNILANVGNGVLDLVWGPDLKFLESSSQIHNYLKSDKYQQVMTEIYAGLGVPQTLTGSSSAGSNSGFTNNFISMKTLIERLEYGRRILVQFWTKELKKLQLAMGWRFPAKVTFDYRVLSDEATEKAMIVDLWDRDLLSNEAIYELCRKDPEMEEIRLRREARKRDNGSLPEKASPYHKPQWDKDLKKILLQGGGVTPSELGIDLEKRKEGELTRNEQLEQTQIKVTEMREKFKPVSPGGDGRPKNAVDKKPRKPKDVKPRTSALQQDFVSLFVWANDAQKTIGEVMSDFFLEYYNKSSLRSLTKAQVEQAEHLKFKILCNLEPYVEINAKSVYDILADSPQINGDMLYANKLFAATFNKKHGRMPTLEERRQIQASGYAIYHEE